MLFHHVQMFAKSLKPLSEYKALEKRLNSLSAKGHFDPFSGGMRFLEEHAHQARVIEGTKIWEDIAAERNQPFEAAGQDIVEQLIVGLGWRVTAEYTGACTRAVLVTSSDPCGVKMVITAAADGVCANDKGGAHPDEPYDHFQGNFVQGFFDAHNDRQSIGVLGFEVARGELETILERYKRLHPKLLISDQIAVYTDTRSIGHGTVAKRTIETGRMSILEVYAYYRQDASSETDTGTVLRFVERDGSFASAPGFANPEGVLPGLRDSDAHFDGTSIPAYSDHWVSNVIDRVGFLSTLQDTLGFVPKVEFNAGVIAAGAARIESTVIGNSSATSVASEAEVLKSQSQVYLPINNALSQQGHVAAFLDQFGQGVQHLASRVQDLISFVERVNNYRTMTGRGLRFLAIPRSYYGILTQVQLIEACDGTSKATPTDMQLPSELAAATIKALHDAQVVSSTGVVMLEVSSHDIASALAGALATLPPDDARVLTECMPYIDAAVKRARYINVYQLLGTNIEESLYLQIVRNQVLVDIQGGDVLLQIFTCKILQAEASHEAPFLEFIQRVCSQCRDGSCEEGQPVKAIKPGCGGFGIRNFLTLFLSIELGKALADQDEAHACADGAAADRALHRALLLNQQLDESNPVLTAIADAMTAEARALETGDDAQALCMQQRKAQLTTQLQELSDRFSALTALAS